MSSSFSGQPISSAVDEDPSGWTLFAAVMILMSGTFNAFDGFIGFFRSTYYIGKPVGGDYWIWALLWLAFGILQIAAGFAIMAGQSWARWFGITIVGLNTLLNLLAMGTYPWWSMTIIAIDLLVIYGLTAGWRRTAA
jgi:hypothetical protein